MGIVGKVGSGKTSLLNAVVAEMFATNGTIELHRKEILEGFGFVPQDNWIQEGTIMSNIQFSLSNVDSDVYQNVVKACALEQDLQVGFLIYGTSKKEKRRAVEIFEIFEIFEILGSEINGMLYLN